jgi:hypothetical protein
MKKTLLICSLMVSSVFFAFAQINIGGVNVNVGRVCGKIDGKDACINPTTGQMEIVTGNGNGISGNINTGQVSGVGTINGVKVGGSGIFGSGGGTTGSVSTGGVGGVSGSGQNYTGILGLLNMAQDILTRAGPLLVGIALIAFFWFLVTFIWKGASSVEEQAKGKKGMLYSILALFVMVSIWGIIKFIGGTIGITQGGTMSGFNLPGKK